MTLRVTLGAGAVASEAEAAAVSYDWPINTVLPTTAINATSWQLSSSTPPVFLFPGQGGGSQMSPLGGIQRVNYPASNVDAGISVGVGINASLLSYDAAMRRGGFRVRLLFGFGTNSPANLAGKRFFAGVARSFDLTVNPSLMTHYIGIGRDSADTELHFMSRGAAGAIKVPIGGPGAAGIENTVYVLDVVNEGAGAFAVALGLRQISGNLAPLTWDVGATEAPSFIAGNVGLVGASINPLATAPQANIVIARATGVMYAGDIPS